MTAPCYKGNDKISDSASMTAAVRAPKTRDRTSATVTNVYAKGNVTLSRVTTGVMVGRTQGVVTDNRKSSAVINVTVLTTQDTTPCLTTPPASLPVPAK